MKIYCCGCQKDVSPRLTDGREIYPHRDDLFSLPFWKCDGCGNYVGCHHKTKDRTRPLGNISTPSIRTERQKIHKILDPLWKSVQYDRKEVYKIISKKLGYEYHTGEIKTVEEAKRVYKIVEKIDCKPCDDGYMTEADYQIWGRLC